MKYVKVNKMVKLKELKEQIKDTKEKLKTVQTENVKLKDELESLWLMMDELNKADIKNWAHLVKQLETDILARSLLTTTKKVDC